MKYSGGLLLTDGFIHDHYSHYGFHPAWKCTVVIELIFTNGILQQEYDRSELFVEIRQRMIEASKRLRAKREQLQEEARNYAEQSIGRKYQI